ncbi:MAG: aromatic-ring-hydroxylating dioxygenase subunit beta [Pseudomonadales bacterium]
MEPSISRQIEQQYRIEQFYFHEAQLLDDRQFQQWLALLDERITYVMPSRINVQVDNKMRDQEAMLDIARELEDEDSVGSPLREENIIHLSMRVQRAYKINSWAENPPARTRRLISNIRINAHEQQSLSVVSNFILYFARPGSANFTYSGERHDQLIRNEDSFKIVKRKVLMDYADIDYPTMGLFF